MATYPSLDINRDKYPAQHGHQNQGLQPKGSKFRLEETLAHLCLSQETLNCYRKTLTSSFLSFLPKDNSLEYFLADSKSTRAAVRENPGCCLLTQPRPQPELRALFYLIPGKYGIKYHSEKQKRRGKQKEEMEGGRKEERKEEREERQKKEGRGREKEEEGGKEGKKGGEEGRSGTIVFPNLQHCYKRSFRTNGKEGESCDEDPHLLILLWGKLLESESPHLCPLWF